MMNVLIACELFGITCDDFRARGHNAWSCDIKASVGSNAYHLKCDALDAIRKNQWDLLIAHPPCTYLSNSGVHWLHRQSGRTEKMKAGAEFFKKLLDANIEKICIENPVMHKYAKAIIGRGQDQTIQPYQFGHPESKRTCLWLKGLPPLRHTNVLEKPECGHWDNQTPSGQNKLGPSKERAMIRGKTYQGIADAMARQWG